MVEVGGGQSAGQQSGRDAVARPGAAPVARPAGATRPRRSILSGLSQYVRQVGRDVVSVALGRLAEPPEQPPAPGPDGGAAASGSDPAQRRALLLHEVAEKLRGAADEYIAAKLDEIEARVDAKLDHIEQRIDDKVFELHRQLQEMRDRELRHRLRLLKLTLILTVLVALLSLGYKWLAKYWLA